MTTHKMFKRKMVKIISLLTLIALGNMIFMHQAFARIVFEDDSLFQIQSSGIVLDYNNNAGTDPVVLQFGNDGTDASYTYDPTTQDITMATPGGDFSFDNDNITTTGITTTEGLTSNGTTSLGDGADTVGINSSSWDITTAGVGSGFTGFSSSGVINFSGATRLAIHSGAANPGTCTEGDIFYNSTSNLLYMCTAANTWTVQTPSSQDFESVYTADADKTLTTTNQAFTVATGTNDFIVDSNDWNVTAAGALDAASIQSNGALTVTGTTSLNGIANIGDGGEAIALSGTTVGVTSNGAGNDVTLTAADDIIFDDAQLTGIIQLTTAATDWDATFSSDGIIDNINSFASTALNEGASNIGINDAGSYLTATTVEGALQEIAAYTGSNADNAEDLTFYPEYPDTSIYEDGSNNRGTLASYYDNTEGTNYYNWTSTRATTQDINAQFMIPLPADFASTGNLTYRYRTGSTTEADNDVEVYMYNVTDSMTLCASDTTNGSAGTWQTGTITAATINTGCTGASALGAGDVILFTVKYYDNNTGGTYADSGYIKLAYNN